MGTKHGDKPTTGIAPVDTQRTVSNGSAASYQQVIDIRLLEFNNLGGSSVDHGNVYAGKDANGTTVNLRTISAGAGIKIIEYPNEIKINTDVDLDSLVAGARSAPGDGQVIYAGISDGAIVLKRLRAADDSVLLSSSANSVDIRVNANKFGDVKDGANLGDAGTGMFLGKTAGVLGFRNIAGTTRLTAIPSGNNLLLDVVESGINVANTTGQLSVSRVSGLHIVATSGSYTDLINKPVLFSGAYSDLTGKPTLFSGSYADLTNKPVLFDGEWTSIKNKPNFHIVATSGSYTDLVNKPVLFDGNYNSLANKPALFDGTYASLTGKPTLFSGSYTDLTNKPTLFSGSYTDLTNKPTIPSKLIDLTDYTGTAVDGQFLKYSAGKWQTAALSVNGFSVAKVGSTSVTATQSGDTLTFAADATLSVTGDATVKSVTYKLANTAVTPGSYTNASITVDAQGRLTAAANGLPSYVDPLTTAGDILFRSASKTDRLPVGATDEVLTTVAGLPKWQKPKVVSVDAQDGTGIDVTVTNTAGAVVVKADLAPLPDGAPFVLDFWTPVVDQYGRTTSFNPPESAPLTVGNLLNMGDMVYGAGGGESISVVSTGPTAVGRYLQAQPDSTLAYNSLFAPNGCIGLYAPNVTGTAIAYGTLVTLDGAGGVRPSNAEPVFGVSAPNAGLALGEAPWGTAAGPYQLGPYGEILLNPDGSPKLNASFNPSNSNMRARATLPAQFTLVGYSGAVYVTLAANTSVAVGNYLAANSVGYGVVSGTATNIQVFRIVTAPSASSTGIAQCLIK